MDANRQYRPLREPGDVDIEAAAWRIERPRGFVAPTPGGRVGVAGGADRIDSFEVFQCGDFQLTLKVEALDEGDLGDIERAWAHRKVLIRRPRAHWRSVIAIATVNGTPAEGVLVGLSLMVHARSLSLLSGRTDGKGTALFFSGCLPPPDPNESYEVRFSNRPDDASWWVRYDGM